MERRLGVMHVDDLIKLIEYITKHQSNTTAAKVKKELGIDEKEYQDLFDLSMPTIRALNEAWFWKTAYWRLYNDIFGVMAVRDRDGIKTDEEALTRIREALDKQSDGIKNRGDEVA